jgi:hypothetical protein
LEGLQTLETLERDTILIGIKYAKKSFVLTDERTLIVVILLVKKGKL